jgi:hypothetical protein
VVIRRFWDMERLTRLRWRETNQNITGKCMSSKVQIIRWLWCPWGICYNSSFAAFNFCLSEVPTPVWNFLPSSPRHPTNSRNVSHGDKLSCHWAVSHARSHSKCNVDSLRGIQSESEYVIFTWTKLPFFQLHCLNTQPGGWSVFFAAFIFTRPQLFLLQ